MTKPADIVRSWFEAVGNLESTAEDLSGFLHEDVTIVEHPNVFSPEGAKRSRDEAIAGFAGAKDFLSTQEFEVHEVIANGGHVAIRSTWRAVVGQSMGPFEQGQELVAQIAAFLVVEDGLIVRQESFDCHEPSG